MYLSSHDLAEGHQHTLNNLATFATTCVGASERLAALFMQFGRQQLARLGEAAGKSNPVGWLPYAPPESVAVLGEAVGIVGDVQQTLIITAAAQTRVLDTLVARSLDRAERSSPLEVLPVLGSLQVGIAQREAALLALADAARQSVAALEAQVAETAGTLPARAAGNAAAA